MHPTTQELKGALGVICAIVYRASQERGLAPGQNAKLQHALNVLSAGREGDELFKGRASYIEGLVRLCGIFSVPIQKPHGTEQILGECEVLQRYLDRFLD